MLQIAPGVSALAPQRQGYDPLKAAPKNLKMRSGQKVNEAAAARVEGLKRTARANRAKKAANKPPKMRSGQKVNESAADRTRTRWAARDATRAANRPLLPYQKKAANKGAASGVPTGVPGTTQTAQRLANRGAVSGARPGGGGSGTPNKRKKLTSAQLKTPVPRGNSGNQGAPDTHYNRPRR